VAKVGWPSLGLTSLVGGVGSGVMACRSCGFTVSALESGHAAGA